MERRGKMMKWIRILFTKKRLMISSKKSQYLFNEMFKPDSKKEINERLKRLNII